MVQFSIDISADPTKAVAGIKRVDQALIALQARVVNLRTVLSSSLAVNPTPALTGLNAINQNLAQLQARVTTLRTQLGRGFVVNGGPAQQGFGAIGKGAERAAGSVNLLRSSFLRFFTVFAAFSQLRKGFTSLVDFSEAIRTAGVVSNATRNQFDALAERARNLGATTRFTAVEAAQGLTSLARAGFDVQESIDTIGNTLNLAIAGNLDLKQATDISASALRGFGIAAADSARVADVLTKAANSANTTVGQLGQALSFVAPIARASGTSIEETSAALDILADAGIKASRGGTSLRIIFAALQDPSETAAAAIRRLGLDLDDVDIRARGFANVIRALSKDQAKFGEEVFKIFDRRGAAAALALARNTDQLEKLQAEFQGAAGSAEDAARRIDQSLLGAFRRVSSAFTEIFLSLGAAGGESTLTNFLDGVAEAFRSIARNVDVLIDIIQALTAVILAKLVRQAFRSILTFALTNPFGLIATGISLAAGALVGFSDKIFVSNDSLATLQDFALSAFEAIRDFAIPLLESIALSINNLFGGPDTISSFEDFVQAIARALDFARQLFTETFITVESGFQTVFVNVGSFIERLFGAASNAVASVIADIVGFFANAFRDLVSATSGAVAVLASVGVLSDETRVAFEESIAVIDKFADRKGQGGANNENLPWTKSDLDDLALETENTLREIDRIANQRRADNIVDTPFQDVTTGIFDNAKRRAEERIRLQREEGALRIQEDAARAEQLKRAGTAADEAGAKVDELNEKVKIVATSFSDGLGQAFFQLKTEAQDFAGVASSLVNGFADTATDALVDFAETGKFSFKDFARSILSDITRVIARLLVVQAISAALGGLGVPLIDPSAVGTAGASAARASGGPVQPNRSFLVGENGPELFTPNRGGNITPNEALQSQPASVTVVNVDDPSMVPAAIADGAADDAIINVLSRNRDKVSRITGTR